jgi:MFS transporter, PPP family, 3-phenylpropionic acid transporter
LSFSWWRLGPAGAAALTASAGMVRWSVTAVTAWLPAMALVEPLHGLTFPVAPGLHADAVSDCSAGTRGDRPKYIRRRRCRYDDRHHDTGIGPLYGTLGPRAFWVMALLCAAALPIAFAMRGISINPSGSNPISSIPR